MKLIVVNAGSSSLKYKVFDKKTLKELHSGHFQRVTDHAEAATAMLDRLVGTGIVESKSEIEAVGHRVVHGGENHTKPTSITPQILKELKKLSPLAPLHNPANLHGIEACRKLLPNARHIAVFDTAFHTTMPEHAYSYAVPQQWRKKYGIRRYGFHGTSHKYVAEEARAALGKSQCAKLATCHLGNGCSITAIKNGESVDTSMGFTPLEGVPMGTRSGSIDPAIIFYLAKHTQLNYDKIEEALEHKSGFKGLCDYSDMRDIYKNSLKKSGAKAKSAQLALGVFAYRIAQYIGAYATSLNGLDTIVFTAGIGENAWYVRKMVCGHLSHLGLELNTSKNHAVAYDRKPFTAPQMIHTPKSKVKILVIHTDEELQIAREIKNLGTL